MSAYEDCFANGEYELFNGSFSINYNGSSFYKMRLSDGMSFAFSAHNNSYSSYGDTEPLSHVIATIYVDINGDKGPNTVGKDFFSFYITKYGIVPAGTPD